MRRGGFFPTFRVVKHQANINANHIRSTLDLKILYDGVVSNQEIEALIRFLNEAGQAHRNDPALPASETISAADKFAGEGW